MRVPLRLGSTTSETAPTQSVGLGYKQHSRGPLRRDSDCSWGDNGRGMLHHVQSVHQSYAKRRTACWRAGVACRWSAVPNDDKAAQRLL